MTERTKFRFAAAGVAFELCGSEEYVRRHLGDLLPFVEQIVGRESSTPPRQASGPSELATWYAKRVPDSTRLTRQDSILVFALWMRSFKKYIFTCEDIRRGFEEIGQSEPKSLLQILGTLKRDHHLILGTERRGEYMLNTTGIERARQVLGIQPPAGRERRPGT